ncbi:MAG TPA: TspO/MBR family protein [Polyangia bacterium]
MTTLSHAHPRSESTSLGHGRAWIVALVIIAATAATAFLGARASIAAADFYAQLVRPNWAPPASWFGPVWTTLYVAMAVAAILALAMARQPARHRRVGETSQLDSRALGRLRIRAGMLYAAQLLANGLWSWFFFAWHNGVAAIVDVVILLILIGLCVRSFLQISRPAGILLVPYFLWVTFATALTIAITSNNRGLL